jgi:hypothetical protein
MSSRSLCGVVSQGKRPYYGQWGNTDEDYTLSCSSEDGSGNSYFEFLTKHEREMNQRDGWEWKR